ncbi:hypothetical protein CAXC1_300026 [Candidatus Xenohaliotis californiensis]|uniref:Uncharacterized protein n=1 Tax=Candidatus Xenohaliotis californiensis TaxID=84677 RepID=A0ABP0ESY5_9RICK|nr:hypothetical protein CAXC1_300026 [Candidatus Xenohaliotis californiensis]
MYGFLYRLILYDNVPETTKTILVIKNSRSIKLWHNNNYSMAMP